MKQTFLILSLLYVSLIFSQSANLDREYFKASYVYLPSAPILEPAKRTFSVNSNAIKIDGFKRVNENATIEIDYKFNGTRINNVEIKKDKHVKKDKDGKVISTTYTYTVNANYASSGNSSVYNHETGKNLTMPFSTSDSFVSKRFNRYSDAQNYYNNNKYNLRDKYKEQHRKRMINKLNYYLNDTYGYPIHNSRDNFWILGKKKHPEYANHIKAYKQAKAILAKMKYNESIDNITEEMQPVINYFKETVGKYPGKKKKMRKMRYASFYNLGKIYYYLDNPDKTIEYGQKLIDNDYDKKDGKHLIKIANELKKRFGANKTNSRHFEVSVFEEDIQDDLDSSESDAIIAYLITKSNDTIQAVIPSQNMDKIKYNVTLEVVDSLNNKKKQTFNATDSKSLALTNGDMYKVILFAEAKKEAGSTDLKFVKVLFESDKIELYLFNNKEIVIKIPNKSAVSTLTPDFVFGLNKKLAEYAIDCPDLLKKVNAKHFKNTQESLTEFAKELSNCK